jgi:hypothetical protein
VTSHSEHAIAASNCLRAPFREIFTQLFFPMAVGFDGLGSAEEHAPVRLTFLDETGNAIPADPHFELHDYVHRIVDQITNTWEPRAMPASERTDLPCCAQSGWRLTGRR